MGTIPYPSLCLQVGKKLPRAQNDTDVNFRSRSINLPGQSVTEDRAGAAVSSRQLTLKVTERPLAGASTSGAEWSRCHNRLGPNGWGNDMGRSGYLGWLIGRSG